MSIGMHIGSTENSILTFRDMAKANNKVQNAAYTVVSGGNAIATTKQLKQL